MRFGLTLSGLMHATGLILLIFGAHLFPRPEAAPLVVSEIEIITEAEYFAQVEQAPSTESPEPVDLAAPAEDAAAEIETDVSDAAVLVPEEQLLTSKTDVPEGAAERPEITPPPRVRAVPSEAPRLTVAEIPIPDSMALPQALQPESRPATEQLSALSSAPGLIAPAPVMPRPVTPMPAPEEAEEKPEETQDEELVEAGQPEAPKAPDPRESVLPVAKPAKLAKAAPATGPVEAAGEAEKPAEVAEKPAEAKPEKPAEKPAEAAKKPAEEPKPAASGSRFATVFSKGEKDGLSLALKQHFTYTGNRSDPNLSVTIAIGLDQTGRITSGPELLRAVGGDPGSQVALFQAGRRALLKAQAAGVFSRLPADKFDAWKLIHVTFFPDERVGFSS